MAIFTRRAATAETKVVELGQLLNRPAPEAQGAAEPKDEVTLRFAESARSLTRDGAIALMFGGARLLPFGAGDWIGIGGGTLVFMNGAMAFIEGVNAKNKHEILDGAMHMGLGGLLIGAGIATSPIIGMGVMVGAASLLGLKTMFDHPKGTATLLFKESAGLVTDPLVGIGLGIKHGAKALKTKVFG